MTRTLLPADAKSRRWPAALFSALLLLAPPARAAEINPEIEALREQHFCEILGYLTAIRNHSPTLTDRYLIIEVAERPGYVQCLLYSKDRKIVCEVASGFYDKPGVRYVPPSAIPALSRLGYSTDARRGNYKQRFRVKDDGSLAAVAELLIRTLHDVYGVMPDHHFRYEAPLVTERPAAQPYVGGQCSALTS